MATGERIHFFRQMQDMTQKELGEKMGFEGRGDVRVAQYEIGNRPPRGEILQKFAACLNVSVDALNTEVETYIGVMHTLFALEDKYGLRIKKVNGKAILSIDPTSGRDAKELEKLLERWADISQERKEGKRSLESYLQWKYCYPEGEPGFAKVPSKDFDDILLETLGKTLTPDP